QTPVQSAPAQSAPAPVVAQAPATGQWVYTAQYGWVWMPYGSQYTYTPTDAGVYPSAYVYYPAYGWTWVAAPWVFGWGIRPFFGVFGPSHFAWYGHLGPRWYGYGFGGFRGVGVAHAFRPGFRPAYGGFHPGFAPGVRTFHGAPSYGH